MEAVFDKGKVVMFLAVVLAVSLLVVVAIMLDLWDGVHTARKTGERVHSHKLRVTIAKVCEYWRFVLIGFLVDCLGLLFSFYVLPFVTLVFGAGLIAVEAKSMFEHASRRKSHAADLGDIVQSILVCSHEHDARKLVDIIVNKGSAIPDAHRPIGFGSVGDLQIDPSPAPSAGSGSVQEPQPEKAAPGN